MIFHITCAPPVEFCEVDPMQTESLASKIAHARALRHIRVFIHMHAMCKTKKPQSEVVATQVKRKGGG